MAELTSQQRELLQLCDQLKAQGRSQFTAVFLNRQLGWGLEVIKAIVEELVELGELTAQVTKGGTTYARPEKPVATVTAPPPSASEPEAEATEREFASIRNRWEVLRVLPAMRRFIEFHQIKSLGGLVKQLGRYGNVTEAFVMAGGIEIAQPTADEIKVLLPGLSKFAPRLELEPPASVQLPPPPLEALPPPAAKEKTKAMPKMTQTRDPKRARTHPAAKVPPKKPSKPKPKAGDYPTWESLMENNAFAGLKFKGPADFARQWSDYGGDDPALFLKLRGLEMRGRAHTVKKVRLYAIGVGLITTEQAEKKAAKKPVASVGLSSHSIYGIPDEDLLRCCQFLQSKAWQQFNDAGIRSPVDLVELIDKYGGDPGKLALDRSIRLRRNEVNQLADLLPLFRRYCHELEKIKPDEARRIVGRLKWHKRVAKGKGKKKVAPRQAVPKSPPASPAKKDSAQTALVPIGQGIITSLELIRLEGKLAERQGKLAEKLIPVAMAVNAIDDPPGDPNDSLEGLVRTIENDLGLLGVRANTNAGLLEMARHALAIKKADMAGMPTEPAK